MPGDISGTFGDRTDPATPVQGCGNSTPADGDMTDPIRTAIGPLPFRDSRPNTGHISTFRPDNHAADFLCPENLCTYLPYDIRASPLVTGTSRNGCPRHTRHRLPPANTPHMFADARLARKHPGAHLRGVKQTPEITTPGPRKPRPPGNQTSCRGRGRCVKIRSARDAFMRRPLSRPPRCIPDTRCDRAPESSRGDSDRNNDAAPARIRPGPATAPEQIRKPETS